MTPPSLPPRICIVMLTALGDAVHVLPVINAIKRRAASTHISWVVQPAAAALVRGHSAVDELLVFERSRGWRALLDMRRELATREFDVVLLLQPYLKAAMIAAFARAGMKIGTDRARAKDLSWLITPTRLPSRPLGHMQDQFLEFLEPLGVARHPMEWNLGPWPEERAWQRSFKSSIERPIASIVVATSKPEKDWMPERWAEVADALHERFGMQVVLVGGKSERELAAQRVVMERTKHKPRSELGSGLRHLVSILDASALVLSPDTGPLHMAVALDRPVISVMGYTNPKRTGPYRRFQDLIVDAYGDPGEHYPTSMENRPGRMGRIETRHVLDKVALWRDRYASERSK